ncbi:hypothetical protein OG978_07025 [Streptomyces sp. NBC_01591]|uniref:hypothetical protein n=1 Tax=Streptomyces sp. NBC_01591 TaxID=2975888 RepID=UPI002DD7B815|nr:hypothetical protein [Streptomyces sp. NBC_01591]WSD67157.1 hypothetical protein OG978_07025 [Streptomyces sp. NBC_01591]
MGPPASGCDTSPASSAAGLPWSSTPTAAAPTTEPTWRTVLLTPEAARFADNTEAVAGIEARHLARRCGP